MQNERYIEEDSQEKLKVTRGGIMKGTEGGLRLDVFDHDANSEYDFSEDDCSLCELPEIAQDYIIQDIENEYE